MIKISIKIKILNNALNRKIILSDLITSTLKSTILYICITVWWRKLNWLQTNLKTLLPKPKSQQLNNIPHLNTLTRFEQPQTHQKSKTSVFGSLGRLVHKSILNISWTSNIPTSQRLTSHKLQRNDARFQIQITTHKQDPTSKTHWRDLNAPTTPTRKYLKKNSRMFMKKPKEDILIHWWDWGLLWHAWSTPHYIA